VLNDLNPLIDFIATLITRFEASYDKADRLFKALVRRRNFGQKERGIAMDAFYLYVRQQKKVHFFAMDNSPEAWAVSAYALVTHQEAEFFPSSVQRWLALSVLEQAQLVQSYPLFWQQQIATIFPETHEEVAHFLNGRAPITLLVLTRRNSVAEVEQALLSQGLMVKRCDLSPLALKVEGRLSKEQTVFFDLQDESSQVMAFLPLPQACSVLDLCAGWGGKSVALGTAYPHLQIIASDIRLDMQAKIASRANRAGVSVRWRTKNQLVKDKFDVVLVDAPCSGSGVWRRNPEDRYRIKASHMNTLIEQQLALLLEAGRMVVAGGELIYITCSFTQQENEELVQTFLTKTKQFSLADAQERLVQALPWQNEAIAYHYEDGPYLRKKAVEGHGDLLFAAILKKQG
jgi:16S rRNA C967 or C1407 C5-methylase (RsmB/RsmF family)